MSSVYVVGDLHFGHKRIHEFRSEYNFENEEHHRETVIENWNKKITKRDIVYVLGDACFYPEFMHHFDRMLGTKYLVRGNHDVCDIQDYLKYFKEVYGLHRYKGCWLSHAPMHPIELRGKVSVHGHVHYATVMEEGYRNVSLENTIDFAPVEIKTVIDAPWWVLKSYPKEAGREEIGCGGKSS